LSTGLEHEAVRQAKTEIQYPEQHFTLADTMWDPSFVFNSS
jgi:hypothetical protein